MNQKQIGTIVILAALAIAGFVYFAREKEERYINSIIHETGSCFLADGTCLHEDRGMGIYAAGWAISAALLVFGIYLRFFDKTQDFMAEQQKAVSSALERAKKEERKKNEFEAFLSGFNDDEKLVLKAVKEQDGIMQSTLRFRTGLSKTNLSLILKSLEQRGFISRKESGKTKEVFLVKRF